MVLWFCGSMVLRPRSAPVLASARPGTSLGHDFMTFSGFSRLFCPQTLPLGEDPNLVGLYVITRSIYHKSLGDVPSMLMEICRIVPKRSPPQYPPFLPGLNFSGFSGFSRLFCPLTPLLGDFELELCVFVGHR